MRQNTQNEITVAVANSLQFCKVYQELLRINNYNI